MKALVSAPFLKVVYLFAGAPLFFAVRTETMKNDVITGKVKSVGISDSAFEAAYKIHVHIKDSSAHCAFYMAVIAAYMVKTIGTPGYLEAADFAHLR